MEWYRFFALLRRDYGLFLRTDWRFIDFLWFPLTSVIIFGAFAVWTKQLNSAVGLAVLAVNIFWSYAVSIQGTVSLSMNEDIWSGTGKPLFATGITKWEYFWSRTVLAILLSVPNLVLMIAIAQLFGLSVVLSALPQTIALAAITIIPAVAVSAIIGAALLFLGRKYTFISWSALQGFILLSSPFLPPALLPGGVRQLVEVMPFTHIFEGARNLITGAPWNPASAIAVGIAYLAIGVLLYSAAFNRARRTGMLARLF